SPDPGQSRASRVPRSAIGEIGDAPGADARGGGRFGMADETLSRGAATPRTLEPPAVMRETWPKAQGDTRFGLIIGGGGMTGLALACAVAGAGVPVRLIEQRALPETTALPFDGRVTAIAQGSRRLREAIGVWPHLADEAQPILGIEVGERHSPLTVHYDH